MFNQIKKIFMSCSGADLEILERPECRTERNKYVGIGATIMSTAVLASFSGGYALYTAFQSVLLSVGFGILWGAIIFNLDRYIVSTLKKKRGTPGAPFRQRLKIKLKEFLVASPRLLLAVFISVIITKPIELRLFKDEIDTKIADTAINRITTTQGDIREHFTEVEDLKSQGERWRQEIREKEKQKDELHELAMQEALGKEGPDTTGRIGKGIVYRERWEAFNKAEAELGELKKVNEAKIASNDRRIAGLKAQEDTQNREAVEQIKQSNGLLARLKALGDLSNDDPTVANASLFLIILFILLETAPVFVKLISDRGPYDDVCETLEHTAYAAGRKNISDLNDEINTEVWLGRKVNSRRLAAEIQLSRSTMASLETLASAELQEAQTMIARLVVAQWKKAELDRLKFTAPFSNPFHNGGAKGKSNQNPSPPTPAPADAKPPAPAGEVAQQTPPAPAQHFVTETEPPEEQPQAAEDGQAVA